MEQGLIHRGRDQERHYPELGRHSREEPGSERGWQQQQSVNHRRPEPKSAAIAKVIDDNPRDELHEQHQGRQCTQDSDVQLIRPDGSCIADRSG